ncbi:helix-turn-helix domain-containing protein [Hymenobacter aranciens]|uniref:helix-turn-helix domain-containing protein n=1 Tax=Hymenobacter aranciens TaxID=3063996 RepID=UPI0035107E66
MHNPFEVLHNRLDKLEALLVERLPTTVTPTTPEIGGLALAQEITRLSKARIYALVSARAIPHSKRGNKLYFSRTELLSWVAAGNRATS